LAYGINFSPFVNWISLIFLGESVPADEGIWTRLQEGERRHVGGFNWRHLRAAL